MGRAAYIEIDPYAAAWLRNLEAAGHIAPGDVFERDIRGIHPDELAEYTQVHAFAGIAGWSLALRIAGWPDDRPVWTGSCPCQPFSVAGKQAGFDDPRHLWPAWRDLIAQRRPATVLGEQVAGAPDWLRLVRSDLEALGYAVGAIPVEAASAGADHFRDRYWIVADRPGERPLPGAFSGVHRGETRPRAWDVEPERHGAPSGSGAMADRNLERASQGWAERSRELGGAGGDQEDHSVPLANGAGGRGREGKQDAHDHAWQASGLSDRAGISDRSLVDTVGLGWGEGWTEDEFRSRGFTVAVASIDGRQYLECPDGKWRRLPPPRVRWLGTRIPARVAKLRAFGNAIDPRPAAQVIAAYMEAAQ